MKIGHRVAAALSQNTALIANPLAIEKLSATSALLIFETSASEAHSSFSQYEDTLASIFDNRFHCVAGTMFAFTHPYMNNPLMRVVVQQNKKAIDYTPDAQANYTLVSANVFQDNEDATLWQLVESNGVKRLVQTTSEDFQSIFNSRKARSSVIASTNDASINYRDGDYVCYFNTAASAVDYGFVNVKNDGSYVLSRKTGEYIRVSPTQILECAFFNDPETTIGKHTIVMPSYKRSEMVLAETFSWDAYLDYMRTLYGNTEFFKALEKLIKEHGVN